MFSRQILKKCYAESSIGLDSKLTIVSAIHFLMAVIKLQKYKKLKQKIGNWTGGT